jgi:hypothetical protein
VKSNPQTSQPGARFNKDDSNEDSPLTPKNHTGGYSRTVATEQRRRTKGVDDTFLLLGNALQTADPLAAVTNHTDTLQAMWASENWDEKVPWNGRGGREYDGSP